LSAPSDNVQLGDFVGQGSVTDDGPRADIAIDDFYSDGINLLIDYTVSNRTAPAFKITVFAVFAGNAPPQPLEVGDGNPALGQHTLLIAPIFSDPTSDYWLRARVDSTRLIAEADETNNVLGFNGGSFLVHEASSGKRIVHVQGTAGPDGVTLV